MNGMLRPDDDVHEESFSGVPFGSWLQSLQRLEEISVILLIPGIYVYFRGHWRHTKKGKISKNEGADSILSYLFAVAVPVLVETLYQYLGDGDAVVEAE